MANYLVQAMITNINWQLRFISCHDSAVPGPVSVRLSSSTPNPVRPIGSTVVLTCTVYALSPGMDDSVIVKTVLNGPAGFMATNISQPILGGSITFTSTAIISSFGQTQSGVYSCTSTLHSDSTLTNAYNNTSGSAAVDYTRVTTGEILLCFQNLIS